LGNPLDVKKTSVVKQVKANATEGKKSTIGGILTLVLIGLSLWNDPTQLRDESKQVAYATGIAGGIYAIAGTGAKKDPK
jgi:hypothetical protein